MDFDRFATRAEEILAEVPEEFLRGIVGVDAHRLRKAHPHISGVYTMGECSGDEVADRTDPGGMLSRIHLYHGSFAALARADEDFDWEAELRETILHEVRHHIEDRAGILDLLEEDAMEDALARWHAGHEFPDGWYRRGEPMEDHVWRVGDDIFVELRLRETEFAGLLGTVPELVVLDEPFEAEVPEDLEPGELISFPGEGLERPAGGSGDLHLVLRTD